MMLGGQRSDVSRTPCSLQGSHVDSPKVVEVVAVSVAVLAVVVVVVEARRVASQRLLLLGSDVIRNKTEETTESVSSKCWRLDSLKLINEIIKGGDAYFNPPIQKQDTVLVADLHVCTSFFTCLQRIFGSFFSHYAFNFGGLCRYFMVRLDTILVSHHTKIFRKPNSVTYTDTDVTLKSCFTKKPLEGIPSAVNSMLSSVSCAR